MNAYCGFIYIPKPHQRSRGTEEAEGQHTALHWHWGTQVQVQVKQLLCMRGNFHCELAVWNSGPRSGKTSIAHAWAWLRTATCPTLALGNSGPSPGKTSTAHSREGLRPAYCPTLALGNSGSSPGKTSTAHAWEWSLCLYSWKLRFKIR